MASDSVQIKFFCVEPSFFKRSHNFVNFLNFCLTPHSLPYTLSIASSGQNRPLPLDLREALRPPGATESKRPKEIVLRYPTVFGDFGPIFYLNFL